MHLAKYRVVARSVYAQRIMDAAAIDAMEPNNRMSHLGNSLYPHIMTLVGESLAGKITGMLLEMSTTEIVVLLTDWEALKKAVGEAVAALPPDMLDLLGEQPSHEASSPVSPLNPSPTSIMTGEGSWTNCDDDDGEPLLPINMMLEAAELKRSAKAHGAEDGEAMDTDDGFVCEWDAGVMAATESGALCAFIAERLHEPQVRIIRAVVDLLGASVALELLFTTERCVFNGGMVVEETGKSRTAGGICAPPLAPPPCLRTRARGVSPIVKSVGSQPV